MIKGCARRMIILKDTGSDFFEEAYFVLKSSPDTGLIRSEKDFVAEANRIIASNSPVSKNSLSVGGKKGTSHSEKSLFFLLGALAGAVSMWGASILL